MGYSQEQIKGFFYHQMNEIELKKLNKLGIDKIRNVETSDYKVKYIENVGYVFVSKGYLIMYDGSEPTTYFAEIFNSKRKAKRKLLNK